MKNNLKEEKGITLIALIITIIVLLILAVVTISAVSEGGIFAHANNAATRWNAAATEENAIIADYLTKMAEHDKEVTPSTFADIAGIYHGVTNSSLELTVNNDGSWSMGGMSGNVVWENGFLVSKVGENEAGRFTVKKLSQAIVLIADREIGDRVLATGTLTAQSFSEEKTYNYNGSPITFKTDGTIPTNDYDCVSYKYYPDLNYLLIKKEDGSELWYYFVSNTEIERL